MYQVSAVPPHRTPQIVRSRGPAEDRRNFWAYVCATETVSRYFDKTGSAKPADPKVAERSFRPCALRQWSVRTTRQQKKKAPPAPKSRRSSGFLKTKMWLSRVACLVIPVVTSLGETHRHDLRSVSANKSCKSTLQAREALKLDQKRCGGLPPLEMTMPQLMMFQPSHQWAVHLSPLSNLKIFVTFFYC